MSSSKFVTAAQAAELIRDGDTVGLMGGGGGLMEATHLFEAVQARFLATQAPRALTVVHALGIGDFQMVQQMLADSVIEINAARWMVYHAAWMLDQGLDAREQIAMVKVHAAETLGRVVDRAVQVFGGMGFCKELPIERYYRDARIYRIFDGTSEIHRGVIAKSALKKGAALFDVNR